MLQMVKRILPVLIGIAVLYGCTQLDLKGIFIPTGVGVEARFEQSKAIHENFCAGTVEAPESYVFYVAADPHIEKTHKNLERFNDAMRNDISAAFGVLLGDCTNVRDNLQAYLNAVAYNPDRHLFNHKIFHILGNHDIFFNGWVDFRESIGPSVYWFEVIFPEGKDLYIALDTATGTLGRKQTKWLKTFLSENRQKYRHCIILTHTNFFYTDTTQASSGNLSIEETFELVDFFSRQNVDIVLQGHDHYRDDLTYDDVRYTVLGAIQDECEAPEYLKVKAGPDGLIYEWEILSR